MKRHGLIRRIALRLALPGLFLPALAALPAGAVIGGSGVSLERFPHTSIFLSSVTIQGNSSLPYALYMISVPNNSGISISTIGHIQTIGPGEGSVTGNPRWNTATDLQVLRDDATQVSTGPFSVIAGGGYNKATGEYAVVMGGQYNTASGKRTFIGGGTSNNVSANDSVVVGGNTNIITGNTIYSAILGGTQNNSSGSYNFISGMNNRSPGSYCAIAGGRDNYCYGGFYNIVGGGYVNAAGSPSGSYAVVPGGRSNTASLTYAFAAGYASSSTASGTFTWSDSSLTPMVNSVADRVVFKSSGGFIVSGSTNPAEPWVHISSKGNVGIGVTPGEERLTVQYRETGITTGIVGSSMTAYNPNTGSGGALGLFIYSASNATGYNGNANGLRVYVSGSGADKMHGGYFENKNTATGYGIWTQSNTSDPNGIGLYANAPTAIRGISTTSGATGTGLYGGSLGGGGAIGIRAVQTNSSGYAVYGEAKKHGFASPASFSTSTVTANLDVRRHVLFKNSGSVSVYNCTGGGRYGLPVLVTYSADQAGRVDFYTGDAGYSNCTVRLAFTNQVASPNTVASVIISPANAATAGAQRYVSGVSGTGFEVVFPSVAPSGTYSFNYITVNTLGGEY
jgi:hypothetical protein